MPCWLSLILLAGLLVSGALFQYIGYLRSKRDLSRAYDKLALRFDGTFDRGSFFIPPSMNFSISKAEAKLSSFYLYRGATGNYTQLVFKLKRSYLHAFVLCARQEENRYLLDSARPDLVEGLLNNEWKGAVEQLSTLGNSRDVEIRFSGDTLLVRKRSLLLSPGNLEIFVKTGIGMYSSLQAVLDKI